MSDGKSMIIVRGNSILKPPLIVTSDAHLIEFHDSFGDLNALLFKVLNDECWALVTKDTPEWTEALIRFGFIKPGGSIAESLKYGTH